MKRAIVLALLLASGAAHASEWVSVNKADDGKSETFIDKASIRVTGSLRKAWAKYNFAHHSQPGNGADSNKWQSELDMLFSYNCAEQVRRMESLTIYYEDGTNTTVPADRFSRAWEPVTPDTVDESMMKFVCAWKKK